jgi:long-chain fatty acid transport protein
MHTHASAKASLAVVPRRAPAATTRLPLVVVGTLLALAVLGQHALPGKVRASGLALPTVGPTNFGVSTTGPLSVHYNPAGLGFARRLRVIVGGDLLIGSIRYQRVRQATYQTPDSLDFQLPIDPSTVDTRKTGRDREVKANPIGVVPSIHVESPLGKLPIAVGFGIDAPYAAIVRWPGAGPQRFQLDDATLATVFTSFGIAYKPTEWLSLGGGVSYVLGYADLTRVQDLAGVGALGAALGRPPINQPNGFGPRANPALRELDTFARPFAFQNGWASGVTFRAGAMLMAAKNLWLSASYEHSTRLNFRGSFSLDMNDPFFTQDLSSQGLDYPSTVRGKASLSMTLPKVVRVGIRHAFGRRMSVSQEPSTSIALEGTFTGWSSVDDFDVRLRSDGLAQPQLGLGRTLQLKLPRDWRNSYGLLLRGSHAVSRKLMLWAAVAGESAAVPSHTIDAASPDGTRVTASGGLSRQLFANFRVILDLTLQKVLDRTITTSDDDLANGSYKMLLVSGGAYADYSF